METTAPAGILQKLRDRTRPQHDALERVARSEKLGEGELSKAEYEALLIANYWAHRYLEEALEANFALTTFLPDWPSRRKLELLHRELEGMNHEPDKLWKQAPVTEAPQLQTEAQAWGVLYVMEGSTLGGAVIAKALQKNSNLAAYMPPRFYGSYGSQTGAYWKAFREKISRSFTQEEAEQEAVEAAAQTFDFYAACFRKAFARV